MLAHGFDLTIDEEIADYVALAIEIKMNPATFFRNIAIILAGDDWASVGENDWDDVRDILGSNPILLKSFESYIAQKNSVATSHE